MKMWLCVNYAIHLSGYKISYVYGAHRHVCQMINVYFSYNFSIVIARSILF